ncbi:MAG TPA: acyltransferase [Firmicutes bacterium]|nr:acyltransferase [Bacillota bacterium]
MKIGYIQFNPVFGEVDRNLDFVKTTLRNADADLIVLPELFNSGYTFTDINEVRKLSEEIPNGKTTQDLITIAKEKNIYIAGGIPEKFENCYFNSSVLVGPNGFIGKYRKSHLFFEENLWFQTGETGFEVFNINGINVGMLICFDWIFPEAMRTLALKGADIILHMTNLVLPFYQISATTRAVENRVFIILSNRYGTEKRNGREFHFTGQSEIVSPKGEILVQSLAEEDDMKIIDINPEEARKKSINEYNDLFKMRRTDLYFR